MVGLLTQPPLFHSQIFMARSDLIDKIDVSEEVCAAALIEV